MYAVDTGFDIEKVSSERYESYLTGVKFNRLACDPEPTSIDFFDVNSNGRIVTATSSVSGDFICVYSADGEFEYGFNFDSYGDCGVEWSGDDLLVCSVRGALIYELTPDGNIEGVYDILDTEESRAYWRKSIYANKKAVNDKVYELKNDMGILNIVTFSHSQLACTDADGNTEMIIDRNSQQLTVYIACIVGSVLFFGLAVVISYFQYKENYKKSKEN